MKNQKPAKLTARIFGLHCLFDGRRWITPLTRLTDRLNDATARIPGDCDSYDLAIRVFRNCGLMNHPDARPRVVECAESPVVDDEVTRYMSA
jgi:hypothetical protein